MTGLAEVYLRLPDLNQKAARFAATRRLVEIDIFKTTTSILPENFVAGCAADAIECWEC
jgi:hypothetical protein